MQKVNINQIAALEAEVAKLQKSLENAKNSYQSLQKQYHEQCRKPYASTVHDIFSDSLLYRGV